MKDETKASALILSETLALYKSFTYLLTFTHSAFSRIPDYLPSMASTDVAWKDRTRSIIIHGACDVYNDD